MEQLAMLGGEPIRTEPIATWPVFDDHERRGLIEVLDSGVWSKGGAKNPEFAQKFADMHDAKHGITVANGSITLEIALKALGIGPGDEVIVPALTWLATAWAPLQVGATPVFADVSAHDWCLDPISVRESITSRTKAIIPVHLYSQVASLDQLTSICEQHNLALIEDCAHTHGSQWDGRGVGSFGDISSFSFQSSKGMTAGEGGIVLTNDDAIADALYGLTDCGRARTPDSPWAFGSNNRMTEFQAAVLLAQLNRLPHQLQRRANNITYLREQLRSVDGVQILSAKPQVTRQGMYCLSLEIDAKAFRGMPR